jgi:hypothetical protein
VQTVVKRGDGIMPAVRVKHATRRLTSVQQLTAVFDECVGPARLEASTRRSYQASWRAVLTWGIAHECVESLLPMSKTTVAQSRRCPKNCSWLGARRALFATSGAVSRTDTGVSATRCR